MKKSKFLQIRVTERFHEKIKEHVKSLETEGKNVTITDFVYQAITEKMKRDGTLSNKNDVMKQIKEMSRKLNGVKENMKEQKITIEKQTKKLENTSKFDTYQDIDNKIKKIISILQEHRTKESYITYKYTGDVLGCKTSEIIQKSQLPRRETWDILKHLTDTNRIVKCKNGVGI